MRPLSHLTKLYYLAIYINLYLLKIVFDLNITCPSFNGKIDHLALELVHMPQLPDF